MKRIKKLASLLLALIMVLSMTGTAFADETTAKGQGNFTITLESDKSGHEYTAYQIFKGDLLVKTENQTESKVLSNIEWGDGINADNLIEKLKAADGLADDPEIIALADDASAADVAAALTGKEKDGAVIQAFADVIADVVTGAGTVSTEIKNGAVTTGYEISPLTAGYYLVKETTANLPENDAYSRYILQVVADVTTKVKAETPTVEKKIVEGSDRVDTNHAGIGQVVSYEIKGKVPDYTGYDKYFYVINDKLSDGLTFNNDVTVIVDGKELTEGTDYYLYTGADADGKTFQVAFANIKAYASGKEILVTYSATVNADAVIGEKGNDNKVTLIYSNNPNSDEVGEDDEQPGKPDGNVPTGISPEDITITYVAEIEITKTKEGGEVLPGAEFTLTGTSQQTVLKGGTYYEVSADGTYYLLKDGTYTEDKPEEETEEYYVNPDVTYIEKTATSTEKVSVPVKMVATSGADGKLTFGGLGAGVYTIEETGVPAGYNKADNITVEIACDLPDSVTDGNETATWSIGDQTTKDKDGNYVVTLDTPGAVYALGIVNMTGAQLPSTGGMGTTIFYAAGIILMAGAVFFIVRRKKA
ncbi:MAG: isopeptide-forming domain-containing fimbrial protein [Lachnospiraceae bacterium]|nr:isopeptide-forming domain-containing fimbrial protein [Lachnospiraceae bacterium]